MVQHLVLEYRRKEFGDAYITRAEAQYAWDHYASFHGVQPNPLAFDKHWFNADTDNDGKLNRTEFEAMMHLFENEGGSAGQLIMSYFDVDNDFLINREEFQAAWLSFQDTFEEHIFGECPFQMPSVDEAFEQYQSPTDADLLHFDETEAQALFDQVSLQVSEMYNCIRGLTIPEEY